MCGLLRERLALCAQRLAVAHETHLRWSARDWPVQLGVASPEPRAKSRFSGFAAQPRVLVLLCSLYSLSGVPAHGGRGPAGASLEEATKML